MKVTTKDLPVARSARTAVTVAGWLCFASLVLPDVANAEQSRVSLIASRLARLQLPGEAQLAQRSDDAMKSIYGDVGQRVPKAVEGRIVLPPLMAATTETDEIGNGRVPDDFRGEAKTPEQPLPESGADRGFTPSWTLRPWAAPNTFSYPLYFEDRMLERHGHKRFGHFQPLAAGVRFFSTFPMLPYVMTVRPAHDARYSLGYYRAGSPAPLFLQRPPYERKAAITQAAAIAGGIIAFP